jgi:DNA repair protein RadC
MTSSTPAALEQIDIWETLRREVLKRAPALSRELEERATLQWQAVLPRDRAALALACALDMAPLTPTVRRHARMLLQQFEEDGLLDPLMGAGRVREEPLLPAYHDLSEKQRAAISHDLRWIQGEDFMAMLRDMPGPVAALETLDRRSRALRGNRGARFLLHLGYPMLVPDKARRRWMHRFGMIADGGETAKARYEALRAADAFAHHSGAKLAELDLFLSAFTGAGEGDLRDAAFCGATPQCRLCPLRPRCQYARFLEAHGKLNGDDKAARRNLSETFLPEDRPREKLATNGAESLTNAELLAIILRTGSGQEHAVELANRILRDAGSLERLARFSIAELTRLGGVGPVKAITIKASLELARRLSMSSSSDELVVTKARDVFEHLRGYFLERRKEQFLCLLLNTKNRVVRQVIVSEGTLNQSLVHPREAFQEAVKDSAAGVIFVHNHPSGDPQPSRDDRTITQRLVKAGEVVGIRVLDHIIIGRESYFSFADEGQLQA